MNSISTTNILLVLEDPGCAAELHDRLALGGFTVEWVTNDEQAINGLASDRFGVLVTELQSSKIDGLRVMSVARDRNPTTPVVFLGESAQVELGLHALENGAAGFYTPPYNADLILQSVRQGLDYQTLQYEILRLKRQLDTDHGLSNLVGHSRAIATLHDQIRQTASDTRPIIIIGESGTGRDHLAQTIHNQSSRSHRSFVKITLRDENSESFEQTLFGFGANIHPEKPDGQAGQVEYADGGSLYLDDVRDLSRAHGDQLMNLFKSGHVQRFGEQRIISVDVRLIVSVTPPLNEADGASVLLDQLQHQLGALTFQIPPLRDRLDDIAPLIQHFVDVHCRSLNKSIAGVESDVLQLLSEYTWPGNVRELSNAVMHMVMGAHDGAELSTSDIPNTIGGAPEIASGQIRISRGSSMSEVERIVIMETLNACNQDKGACARSLGIGLRTLYRKLNAYAAEGS